MYVISTGAGTAVAGTAVAGGGTAVAGGGTAVAGGGTAAVGWGAAVVAATPQADKTMLATITTTKTSFFIPSSSVRGGGQGHFLPAG